MVCSHRVLLSQIQKTLALQHRDGKLFGGAKLPIVIILSEVLEQSTDRPMPSLSVMIRSAAWMSIYHFFSAQNADALWLTISLWFELFADSY